MLGVALLALYAATMPAQVALEDGATFAGACATLGLAHPPGYPLHTLSCYPVLSAATPLGLNFAQGAALASALAAALACVVLAHALWRMCGCLGSAVLAAGSLGLAPAFWAQAVIPEAYALNILLLALALALAERVVATGAARHLVGLALVAGLGLSNHWPLFALSAPAILIFLLLRPRLYLRLLAPIILLSCLGAFAVGLLPYAHLWTVDPRSFLFLHDYSSEVIIEYIARSPYKNPELDLTPWTRVYSLLLGLGWIVIQHAYLLGLFALGGLGLLAIARSWALAGASVWGMLATTALLAALREFDPYDEYSVAVFSTYPLPAYMFATLPMAFGLSRLFSAASLAPQRRLGAALLVLVALAALRFNGENRSEEDFAVPHARQVLASLEPGTLLLLDTSDASQPLKFVNYFEAGSAIATVRDIDYFYDFKRNNVMSAEDSIVKLASESLQVAYLQELNVPPLGQRFHGTHFSLDSDVAPGAIAVSLDDGARQVLSDMADGSKLLQRNFHSAKYLEDNLIIATSRLLNSKAGGILAPADDELLAKLLATVPGRYAAFYLLARSGAATLNAVQAAALELEPDLAHLSDSRRSTVYLELSSWQRKNGDLQGAIRNMENAIAVYPSVHNQIAIHALLGAYAEAGDAQKYAEFRGLGPRPRISPRIRQTDQWCAREIGGGCL